MRLIYFYVEKYEDIMKNEEVDFKSKYRIKFKNGELSILNNENYIENFYSEYKNIKEVTAIIGKNTSGKSSILKIINKIWNDISSYKSDCGIKYLIVFEDDNGIKFYNNLGEVLKINNKISNLDIEEITKNKDTTIIYFSGIFDRNPGLSEESKFIDIGTNTMFRKSIYSTYERKRKVWNIKNDVEEELEFGQFDFVDEFRRQETLKLMNYYLNINNSEWEQEILFDFPRTLNIFFEQNDIIYKEFKSYIEYENPELFEYIDDLVDLINRYIQYYENVDDNIKGVVETKFALLVYYELIEQLYKVEQIEVMEWMEDILDSDIDITANNIIENMRNFYSKEKIVFYSKEEYEIASNKGNYCEKKDVNIHTTSEKEEYKSNKIKGIIYDIECLEENTEENLKKIYYEIVELIEEIGQRSDSFLFEESIDDLEEKLVFENSDSEYKELYYSEDKFDEMFYMYKEEIIYILESMEKIYVNEDSYCYEAEGNIDYIEPIDNEKSDNELNEKHSIINTTKENVELKKIVDKYIELIEIFKRIVNKKGAIVENSFDLKVNWKDEDIIKFFNKFDEIKIYTFIVEIESSIVSSGQVTYFELQYRLYDLISNIQLDKNIILMIDEGDIYMHPGVQINFIKHTMRFLKKFLKEKEIQVIITSNSPFIISDIPNSKIIYIDKKNNGYINVKKDENLNKLKTLGTPINELLVDSFFMDEGIVGKLAQDKITYVINQLYVDGENLSIQELENLEVLVNSIGDEIIRWKLSTKIEELMKNSVVMRERLIEKYKKKIEELEGQTIE